MPFYQNVIPSIPATDGSTANKAKCVESSKMLETSYQPSSLKNCEPVLFYPWQAVALKFDLGFFRLLHFLFASI